MILTRDYGPVVLILAASVLTGCSGQTNNPLTRPQASIRADLPYRPFMPQAENSGGYAVSTPPAYHQKMSGTAGMSALPTGNVPQAVPVRMVDSTAAGHRSAGNQAAGVPSFPRQFQGSPAAHHPTAAGASIPDIQPVTTGTYGFVVPPDISSFKKTGDLMQEYLLYYGRPKPNQKPFLTMVLSRHVKAACVGNPLFVIKSERRFVLNGLLAHEYAGYTAAGRPFAELILHHPRAADKLDALAIVPNETQRNVALKILKTIHWKAN